jgi:hypothetical protein
MAAAAVAAGLLLPLLPVLGLLLLPGTVQNAFL